MAQKDSPFTISIEDAGPARKRISITVPAETVDAHLGDQMSTLRSQTNLPGFRKGKAPAALLERRFGSAIREEAKGKLISDGYAAALEEHDLQTLGEPEPVEDPSEVVIEEGKPFSFSLEIEIMPTFDLPALDGIQIVRPVVDVEDAHIDEEIDRQKTRHGEVESVTDQVVAGDFLVGAAHVTRRGEDEPFFKTEQTRVAVPAKGKSGQFLGLLIDDLGDRVASCSAGDTITIEATGPETHEMEEVRGADLSMVLEIAQVMRVIALDDEGLQAFFGLDDQGALREQIRMALERRRDDDQAMVLREQAIEKISGMIEMELPEKASASQADRNLARMRLELVQSGRLSEEEVEHRLAEARAGSVEESRGQLKQFFILSALADHFHVTVGEAEVNARIARIAMQNGLRPEQVRSDLASRGQLTQISAMVREEKAADQLVAACTVTEMPVADWQSQQAQKPAAAKKTKKKTAKKTASKKKTAKKTSKKKTSAT